MVKPTIRSRLTEAALALFDEHGYERTTVEDIAARAGVGRTTFFRAFATKEDVIFPHHEEVLGAVQDRLAAATPATADIAVIEAARLVLRHYLTEDDVARVRYRLTSTVPALRHREIAGMQAYHRVFREFLVAHHPGATDSPLRAELMAAGIVTAHNYVLRRWLRGITTDAVADFDEAMVEMLDLFRHRDPAQSTAEQEPALVVFRTSRPLTDVLPALQPLLGPAEVGPHLRPVP